MGSLENKVASHYIFVKKYAMLCEIVHQSIGYKKVYIPLYYTKNRSACDFIHRKKLKAQPLLPA